MFSDDVDDDDVSVNDDTMNGWINAHTLAHMNRKDMLLSLIQSQALTMPVPGHL